MAKGKKVTKVAEDHNTLRVKRRYGKNELYTQAEICYIRNTDGEYCTGCIYQGLVCEQMFKYIQSLPLNNEIRKTYDRIMFYGG